MQNHPAARTDPTPSAIATQHSMFVLKVIGFTVAYLFQFGIHRWPVIRMNQTPDTLNTLFKIVR
jgi:hypothetical protein